MLYDQRNMKKILIIILLAFLASSARSQSLTAKDLVNFFEKADKNDFLESRSFILLSRNSNDLSESFIKNSGATNQESILFTDKLVSYMTRSNVYIKNLLLQLQHQYKQTSKDDGPDFIYYRFAAGDKKYISVSIPKSKDNHYTLQVIQKQ